MSKSIQFYGNNSLYARTFNLIINSRRSAHVLPYDCINIYIYKLFVICYFFLLFLWFFIIYKMYNKEEKKQKKKRSKEAEEEKTNTKYQNIKICIVHAKEKK